MSVWTLTLKRASDTTNACVWCSPSLQVFLCRARAPVQQSPHRTALTRCLPHNLRLPALCNQPSLTDWWCRIKCDIHGADFRTKIFNSFMIFHQNKRYDTSEITKSSATAKSTARPSCLVGILYCIYRRQTTDQLLINHFYETGQETCRIPRNNAK